MPGSQFSFKGFSWDNAMVYFMLTGPILQWRQSNDFQHPKDVQPAPLRGYMVEMKALPKK